MPLSRARDLEPGKASVREALGRALFGAQRYREAEREFAAVVEHAPTNGYALFCLGRSLQLQGRHAEARHPLALACCLSPERADYRRYRDQARRARPERATRPARSQPAGRRYAQRSSSAARSSEPSRRSTSSPRRRARSGISPVTQIAPAARAREPHELQAAVAVQRLVRRRGAGGEHLGLRAQQPAAPREARVAAAIRRPRR